MPKPETVSCPDNVETQKPIAVPSTALVQEEDAPESQNHGAAKLSAHAARSQRACRGTADAENNLKLRTGVAQACSSKYPSDRSKADVRSIDSCVDTNERDNHGVAVRSAKDALMGAKTHPACGRTEDQEVARESSELDMKSETDGCSNSLGAPLRVRVSGLDEPQCTRSIPNGGGAFAGGYTVQRHSGLWLQKAHAVAKAHAEDKHPHEVRSDLWGDAVNAGSGNWHINSSGISRALKLPRFRTESELEDLAERTRHSAQCVQLEFGQHTKNADVAELIVEGLVRLCRTTDGEAL